MLIVIILPVKCPLGHQGSRFPGDITGVPDVRWAFGLTTLQALTAFGFPLVTMQSKMRI